MGRGREWCWIMGRELWKSTPPSPPILQAHWSTMFLDRFGRLQREAEGNPEEGQLDDDIMQNPPEEPLPFGRMRAQGQGSNHCERGWKSKEEGQFTH